MAIYNCVTKCCASLTKDASSFLKCAQDNSRRLIDSAQPVTAPPPSSPPDSWKVLLFGGSMGADITAKGPDPRLQSPVWFEIAQYVIPYPGTKWGQSRIAIDNSDIYNANLVVVGYSAGADSALMFANEFTQNKRGTGNLECLVLLGGTMTGATKTLTDLQYEWKSMLDAVLSAGTDVYILDDKDAGGTGNEASAYAPPLSARGRFKFEQRLNQPHWDGSLTGQIGNGTNNNPQFRDEVIQWCKTQ